MAYAAVVSLKHTIQRLLNSSQIPIPSSLPEIIQLTYEKVESLQELFTLEDGSNNQRVKAVEREIREAAWRLEDVLESAHLSNHHHFLSQSHETLNGDFSIRVKEEIIFFTETVKKIEEQLGNASLPEEEEDDVVVSSRIDQYFGLKKPKIVGLTDELLSIRDSIIDFPYEDPERLIVVAVEGMAGIGKTALVTAAYLHPRIVSHFECRAFVSIGPTKSQLRRILLCIIAQINPEFDTSGNAEISDHEEELASCLYSCLKNRRYLIVVDEVWNTRVWDELKKAFPDDRNNSRVIVTTRLFNIAKHASSTIFLHRKRFLNDEESWHLLREKVFGGEKNSCPSHLDEAGRKIAENCQGLPLMIITLAKHLSQAEKTAEYWEKVAKKEHSDIIAADEEFFKVLAPSYHHLPQHLKACFLYMGIFPLDYNIPASKLIKLWCAEEFLESNMTTSLEYVAMESLDQLMYANVVMICEQRFSIFAITKTCKLHPAFLHLCMREAGKNNFFHVIGSSVNRGIESQRRLCIHNNSLFGIKDVRQLMASVSNMRSLLCSGPHHPYPVPICLGSFSLLSLLDALTIRFYRFPDEVIKLVKLRYIAFTYNGELPASISKLQNLQYLIVHQYLSIISSGAHRWYLPMEIWNMEELRHLEVMGSDLPEPSYDTAYLCNLLTLSGISTRSCTKEVLERVPNLMELGIQIRLADDVVVEPLCCLADLASVITVKCCIVNPKHISQVVSTPPRVPIFPSNIRKLTLSGFGFPWEQMSTIAHLPELQVLKLQCNAFQGQEWTTYEGEFPQLQFLLLEDIDLRYWTAHHPDCFPLLSDLMIRHCYKLERIPPKYGGKPYLRIDLIECNPGLVAFAKEEILKKDELENESRLMLIKIESSADDRRQFMGNYRSGLNSGDIRRKTEQSESHEQSESDKQSESQLLQRTL